MVDDFFLGVCLIDENGHDIPDSFRIQPYRGMITTFYPLPLLRPGNPPKFGLHCIGCDNQLCSNINAWRDAHPGPTMEDEMQFFADVFTEAHCARTRRQLQDHFKKCQALRNWWVNGTQSNYENMCFAKERHKVLKCKAGIGSSYLKAVGLD
jgi:hypothetical protein